MLPEQRHHLCRRTRTLGGHQPSALLGEGRVQADGQVTLTLPQKATQPIASHTNRGDGDAPRTQSASVIRRKYFKRLQHLVHIIHRLPHTHEDQVAQRLGLGQVKDLVHDLARCQVCPEALPPRHAETARHAATYLRGYTERIAPFGRDVYGLHKAIVASREEVLHCAIG